MRLISECLPRLGAGRTTPQRRAALASLKNATRDDASAIRYQILNLIRQVRDHIQLDYQDPLTGEITRRTISANHIEHLEYLVNLTSAESWRSGMPVVYKKQIDIAHARRRSTRTIRNWEADLEAFGFVMRLNSGNYRRFARTEPTTGETIHAFGICLAPMLDRFDDLRVLKEAIDREDEQWRRDRDEFMRLRQMATELINEAIVYEETRVTGQEFGPKILALGVPDEFTSITHIERMANEVKVIILDVQTVLETVAPAHEFTYSSCVNDVDISGQPEINFRHTKDTIKPKSAKADSNHPVDDFKKEGARRAPVNTKETCANAPVNASKREAVSNSTHSKEKSPPQSTNGAEHVSVLHAFAVAGKMFKNRFEGDPDNPGYHDVLIAAETLRPDLGVSAHAWEHARFILGDWGAVLALILAERRASNPGGYIRGMTKRALIGDLRLHKSIFGLLRGEGQQ